MSHIYLNLFSQSGHGGEGIPLTGDLNHPDCPWVFFREGQPIRDYRTGWANACKRVGLEGRLFHDLRRTGVR